MTENLPQVQAQSNLMPTEKEFQMLQVIAKNAQDSGLYSGVGQQAKIFMVLLAARELGVSPMLALNGGIWNINGKIEISARLMNGLIRRAGHSIKIVVSNDTHCTLLGTRSDGDSFECSFNMDDAVKAGLASGNVWKKYPADMLYNRCMSRLARRLFSDVIGNSYVEGEIRESKEVERLEQVECEVKPSIPTLNQENKHDLQKNDVNYDMLKEVEKVITSQEYDQLMTSFSKTTQEFRINCEKYRENEWKLDKWEDLPTKYHPLVMKWIAKNIQAQTEGAVK